MQLSTTQQQHPHHQQRQAALAQRTLMPSFCTMLPAAALMLGYMPACTRCLITSEGTRTTADVSAPAEAHTTCFSPGRPSPGKWASRKPLTFSYVTK